MLFCSCSKVPKRIVFELGKLIARNYSKSSLCEEVKIPVAWGNIAGQWWGSRDQRPIVALPGWRECSSSFEPLAAILSKHIPVLCIDLPGVGLSSHIPDGMAYNSCFSLDSLRIIMQHFQWNKISLLGHSMGSGINFLFASCYPEQTDFYIGIDGLVLPHTRKEIIAKMYRQNLELLLEMFKTHVYKNGFFQQQKPNYYTYDQICDEVIKMTFGSLTRDYASLMLKRELIEVDNNKYLFRMDPRVHLRMPGWCREQLECFARTVTSPTLNIKTTDWRYVEGEQCYKRIVEIICENNSNFQRVDVKGAHHIHVTHPETVLPHILEFIAKFDNENRLKK